ESCVVEGDTIRAVQGSPQGAMRVDAMYLLMFRTFNPKDFNSAHEGVITRTGSEIAVKTLQSPQQTLHFDAASGRLLRAELQIEQGQLVMDLDDYKTVGDGVLSLPHTVELHPPPGLFRSPVPGNILVRLTIDPSTVAATHP
ncbi:MAG TPA: hypothetical protein VH518_20325, partial [Tepidisphaeraceae bacterium]